MRRSDITINRRSGARTRGCPCAGPKSFASAAVLLIGILVGATLVLATPVILGNTTKTTTIVSTYTSTAVVTSPPSTVTTTITTTLATGSNPVTATQFGVYGVKDLVQSCGAYGDPSQTVSCSLADPVRQGDLLVVVVTEVPGYTTCCTITSTLGQSTTSAPPGQSGISISDTVRNSFSLAGQAATRPGSSYLLYFFVARVVSSAQDTVTVSGSANYPSIMVHRAAEPDPGSRLLHRDRRLLLRVGSLHTRHPSGRSSWPPRSSRASEVTSQLS